MSLFLFVLLPMQCSCCCCWWWRWWWWWWWWSTCFLCREFPQPFCPPLSSPPTRPSFAQVLIDVVCYDLLLCSCINFIHNRLPCMKNPTWLPTLMIILIILPLHSGLGSLGPTNSFIPSSPLLTVSSPPPPSSSSQLHQNMSTEKFPFSHKGNLDR